MHHFQLHVSAHVSLYPLPIVALQHNDVQVVEVTASHPTQPAEAQNWPKMEDENGVIDGNKNLHYTSITAIQTYPNSFLKNGTLFVFLCPRPPCWPRVSFESTHLSLQSLALEKELTSIHQSSRFEKKKPMADWGFATWKLLFQGTCRSCSKSMEMVTLQWDCGHSLPPKQLQHTYSCNVLWRRLCNCARVCIFAP